MATAIGIAQKIGGKFNKLWLAGGDGAVNDPTLTGDYGTTPDFYIDPVNGDDTNPGTKTRPLKTITKALTKIVSVGNIRLKGGCTYNEGIVSSYKTLRITIDEDTSLASNDVTINGEIQMGDGFVVFPINPSTGAKLILKGRVYLHGGSLFSSNIKIQYTGTTISNLVVTTDRSIAIFAQEVEAYNIETTGAMLSADYSSLIHFKKSLTVDLATLYQVLSVARNSCIITDGDLKLTNITAKNQTVWLIHVTYGAFWFVYHLQITILNDIYCLMDVLYGSKVVGSAVTAINTNYGNHFNVRFMKTFSNGHAILVDGRSLLNLIFGIVLQIDGTCTTNYGLLTIQGGSTVVLNNKIHFNAPNVTAQYILRAFDGSTLLSSSPNVSLIGNASFGIDIAYGSVVRFYNPTFSGSITGKKCRITTRGNLFAYGRIATLPGTDYEMSGESYIE